MLITADCNRSGMRCWTVIRMMTHILTSTVHYTLQFQQPKKYSLSTFTTILYYLHTVHSGVIDTSKIHFTDLSVVILFFLLTYHLLTPWKSMGCFNLFLFNLDSCFLFSVFTYLYFHSQFDTSQFEHMLTWQFNVFYHNIIYCNIKAYLHHLRLPLTACWENPVCVWLFFFFFYIKLCVHVVNGNYIQDKLWGVTLNRYKRDFYLFTNTVNRRPLLESQTVAGYCTCAIFLKEQFHFICTMTWCMEGCVVWSCLHTRTQAHTLSHLCGGEALSS